MHMLQQTHGIFCIKKYMGGLHKARTKVLAYSEPVKTAI